MQDTITKEQELMEELESWKETCEILSNKEILDSIKRSLKQIENGEEILLSEL